MSVNRWSLLVAFYTMLEMTCLVALEENSYEQERIAVALFYSGNQPGAVRPQKLAQSVVSCTSIIVNEKFVFASHYKTWIYICICLPYFFTDTNFLLFLLPLAYRRFLKRIIWHSEWIVPELKNTLSETHKRQQSFTKSFNALLELFKILDSTLHVEELMVSKAGIQVHIRQTVELMSQSLADKSLDDFYDKVHCCSQSNCCNCLHFDNLFHRN